MNIMFGGNARKRAYNAQRGAERCRTTYYSQNARRNENRHYRRDSYDDSIPKTASRAKIRFGLDESATEAYRAPSVSCPEDLIVLRDYLSSEFGSSEEFVHYCIRTRPRYTEVFGETETVQSNLAMICGGMGLCVSEEDLNSIAAKFIEKARVRE